jgi:putative phosphoesterase
MDLTIGLVSDTHGLLRPEVLKALQGVDRIVHAGDIGDRAILQALEALAPVTAVRGNNDHGASWADVPDQATLDLGETRLLVIHDLAHLRQVPAGVGVVVSGHSHQPAVEQRRQVLFVNPGSAGPRRFRLPVTVALLTVDGAGVDAKILDLMENIGV